MSPPVATSTWAAKKRLTPRVLLVLFLHACVFAASFWTSFNLRYDLNMAANMPSAMWATFWMGLLAVLAVKPVLFYAMGHCHGWWRYVTFADLTQLLRAATVSSLVLLAIDRFAIERTHIPRSILLLDWGLTILLLGGLRSMFRLSREQFWPMARRKDARRALIVGTDESSTLLARQLELDPRGNYLVSGFLDSNAALHGSWLGGIPVLGGPESVNRLAASHGVDVVLTVSGSLSGRHLRDLMSQTEQAGLSLKVLPGVDDLLKSNHRVHVRDVDINDLLRREPVYLQNERIEELLQGRRVMVTGAGGSIGSEICRQVLRFQPAQLVLVEQAENSLFTIEQELLGQVAADRLATCIADVCDRRRLEHIFATHRPEVVFHAAAHKHVPLMERNPGEALKNNVLGTKLLVDLCHQFAVRSFVMISTDKAVNPTSIMGVSKQLAERYVHAFSESSTQTRFVVVRFGNVLGSAGSVVPIFQEQIRHGGPVTVTHPDIERYFMTIPEASQLVLQSGAMGQGGEIYVLDMGVPVKIVDLAKDLIHLSGFTTDDIEIAFTGLRPGEKLYEELYFQNEQTLPTQHPKVFVAYHRPFSLDEVIRTINHVIEVVDGPPEELRRRLHEALPEYADPAAAPAAPPPAASQAEHAA